MGIVKLKKDGITYVYESESYWDKEKKQPRSKRKLIGHIDPETGEVVPNRKRSRSDEMYARTITIGQSLLFDRVSESIGLDPALRSAFMKDADKILTCAYYLLSEGNALGRCEQWSAGNLNPYGKRLGDQRIAELLKRLTPDSQKRFFRDWVKTISEEDNLAIDVTSISSYSDEIEAVRAGYNRDNENLEQVNVALMVGSKTYRPAYYSILPGNINDRSSLKRFLRTMEDMGFEGFKVVMDKGFCTVANIDLMYEMKLKFTVSVVNNLNFTKDAVSEVKGSITEFSNFRQVMGSEVYVKTSLKEWNGHRCYTHVYYDETKKDNDKKRFMKRLLKCRTVPEENGKLSERDVKFAEKYFIVKETPKRGRSVIPNEDAIKEFREKDAGYLVIISNHEKDAVKALEIYRCKETAELSFDDLKNDQGFGRMHIHSEEAMDGKAFIHFVALAINLEIKRTTYSHPELKNRTEQEIIDEMKLLRATKIKGRHSPLFTELTSLQKKVISAFGIPANFDISMPDADEPEFEGED